MDIFERLNSMLEPLGGPLHTDGFIEAIRQAEEAARPEPRNAVEPPVTTRPPESSMEPEDAPPAPTEGLENEVQQFMTRHRIDDADQDEIQEFLKERSGYDPTQVD